MQKPRNRFDLRCAARLPSHSIYPAYVHENKAFSLMRTMSVIVVFFLCGTSAAQNRPPMPYQDWGACPFECCTYQAWEAVKPVIAHQSLSTNSPMAFRVRKKESVQGMTGVVITTRYGVTKILKPMQIGYTETDHAPELSLNAGDIVYTLHYLGEGDDLFWYQGKLYSGQTSDPEYALDNTPVNLQVISRPKTDWWVKIRNLQGNFGWTNDVRAFVHVDACE